MRQPTHIDAPLPRHLNINSRRRAISNLSRIREPAIRHFVIALFRLHDLRTNEQTISTLLRRSLSSYYSDCLRFLENDNRRNAAGSRFLCVFIGARALLTRM